MVSKEYVGQFKTSLLTEEILEAFPEWAPDPNNPFAQPAFTLFVLEADGEIVTHLRLEVPDGTDMAKLDAVVAAHIAANPTVAEMLRGNVAAIAQSAVGVRLSDLTAAQIKALMACMLYKAGGVNPKTMQVRPLNDWL